MFNEYSCTYGINESTNIMEINLDYTDPNGEYESFIIEFTDITTSEVYTLTISQPINGTNQINMYDEFTQDVVENIFFGEGKYFNVTVKAVSSTNPGGEVVANDQEISFIKIESI